MNNHQKKLINKYNIPGPRYTSYPTVPYWDNTTFKLNHWKQIFQQSFTQSNTPEGISLYIHLPFCEQMCTFCACNKRITKNHDVEKIYLDYVKKEWDLYQSLFTEKPKLKEIHLGGGTPSFFDPLHLKELLEYIYKNSLIADNHEFSFEGHPNNTTEEHLKTLYELGFRRVSFGVQDLDPIVQKAINRIQPFENVAKVTQLAREIGYTSISHDLVFGLPFQQLPNMVNSIEKIASLNPDRIAFYSYAHVPWIKGIGQRGFQDEDLPSGDEKRELYLAGKACLEKNAYHEIGMDHFAKAHDSLYIASQNKNIHRNFMGYNSSKTQVMIGLGVSAIGDAWYSFSQNVKELEQYYHLLNNNELPIFRGHILTSEDLIIRRHILNLMCSMQTSFEDENLQFPELEQSIEKLQELFSDDLLQLKSQQLIINEKGRPFLRNICMAFDLRMSRNEPQTRIFSMTV